MKTFNLVIPAYNEEKNIPLLLEKTLAAAKEFGFTESNFSLLLVDNGSSDNSFKVMSEWIQKNETQGLIKIIRVPVNQGYGFGIFSGLKEEQAEVVGWTHADLQCDPRNAFLAYKLLNDNKSLVKGIRRGRAPQERLVSLVFRVLAYIILGIKTGEINAQPKVFHRDLLSALKNPPFTFAFDLYVLYCAQKQGLRIIELPVTFPPRIHGVSHWAAHFTGRYKTIWGMIIYMIEVLKTQGRA